MKLKPHLDNSRDLRKNTRIILEKLKDLSYGNKFKTLVVKRAIAPTKGLDSDVQVCVKLVFDSFGCLSSSSSITNDLEGKKYNSLRKSLLLLNDQIKSCLELKKPLKRRYITNALRSHTNYFKILTNRKIAGECESLYQDLILASVAVWNNSWHGKRG